MAGSSDDCFIAGDGLTAGRQPKRHKPNGIMLVGQRRLSRGIINTVIQSLPADIIIPPNLDMLMSNERRFASDELWREVGLTIDLQLEDSAGVFKWQLVNPQAVLRKLVSGSEALKRVMRQMRSSASNPLSIIIYHDEITPGNIAKPANDRKMIVFRYSFKELGRLENVYGSGLRLRTFREFRWKGVCRSDRKHFAGLGNPRPFFFVEKHGKLGIPARGRNHSPKGNYWHRRLSGFHLQSCVHLSATK